MPWRRGLFEEIGILCAAITVLILVFAEVTFSLWNLIWLIDLFASTFSCFQFPLHSITRVNFLQNKGNDIIVFHINLYQFLLFYRIETRHAARAHRGSTVSCVVVFLASPLVFLGFSHVVLPLFPECTVSSCASKFLHTLFPLLQYLVLPSFLPSLTNFHSSLNTSVVGQNPSSASRALCFLLVFEC